MTTNSLIPVELDINYKTTFEIVNVNNIIYKLNYSMELIT